jgi:hypothetical protein
VAVLETRRSGIRSAAAIAGGQPVGIFRRLFGREDVAPQNPFNSGPELVGGLLLYQFFPDSRPLVTDEELKKLCQGFQANMREHVNIWLIMFSAWLLKVLADAKYGQDFGRALMAAVFGRLAANEDRLPEGASLAEGIKFWFKQFDAAVEEAARNPIVINGEVLPAAMHIALMCLVRDSENPYASQAPNFEGVDFDVAEAIAYVQDLVKPRAYLILEQAKDLPR